jgi:hypothetical protein
MSDLPHDRDDTAARAERARAALAHPFPVLAALEAAGGTSALGLGRDGVAVLPDGIRAAGFAAIDALAATLCGLYPNGGVGQSLEGPELARIVELLDLGPLMPDLLPTLRLRDVAGHLAECARLTRMNPILVVAAAEYMSLPADVRATASPPLDNPDAADELRSQVALSALLEAIGLAYLLAPKASTDAERAALFNTRFAAQITERLHSKAWKTHCNLFEVLKIKLVEKPLGERLRVKQGLDDTLFDQRSGGGLTLQLNILDAMYEDTLLGNDTNAEAGFELMAHTFDKDPQPLVGERYTDEWHLDGKPMGVGRCHMAFADAWVMLYSSWNGAFCANYPELVFAKLFNPGVAGAAIAYGPEVYFSPRVPTLFITLVLMVLSRERAGARRYGRVDWRDDALRIVWGRVNEVAAGAYQDRVEKALAEDWAPTPATAPPGPASGRAGSRCAPSSRGPGSRATWTPASCSSRSPRCRGCPVSGTMRSPRWLPNITRPRTPSRPRRPLVLRPTACRGAARL